MATLTAVRTVDEVIAGWRTGEDTEGMANPAGPVFSEGYAEQEITMTGSGFSIPIVATATTAAYNPCTGESVMCC